jgi:hypothetical protein
MKLLEKNIPSTEESTSYFGLTKKQLIGLPIALWMICAVRFALPVFDSPYERIISDMQIHFDCGRYTTIFNPFSPNVTVPNWINVDCEIANAIEPKPFQIFMSVIARVNPLIGSALFGFLSASLVMFVFLMMRGVGNSINRSLGTALVVSLCPTLTWCFGYFLNENLMLFFLAAGLWCVTRSLEPTLDESKKFFWMSLSFWCLFMSALTKMVALPIFAAWLLLYAKSWIFPLGSKKKSLAIQTFAACFIVLWFSLSTYHRTGFLNPFGKSLQSILLRRLGTCGSAFALIDEEHGNIEHRFGTGNTPICFFPTFGIEKLGKFKPISRNNIELKISQQWAPLRWEKNLRFLEKNITPGQKFAIWWQNLRAGLTTPSYPETSRNWIFHDNSLLSQVGEVTSYASTVPLFVLLLSALGFAIRYLVKNRRFLLGHKPNWATFLSLSIFLSWVAFIIQQEGVFEPRYRKGLDLISILILAQLITSFKRKKSSKPKTAA